MLLLSVFGQQDLTRVVSSLGESAQFSQTEVSGTATSKSCRLAHPNGRDFYDLRGVGDHVFEASADTSVPFGPALWNARVVTSAVRCAWGCPDSWRGDGECDAGCNVTACNFDGGDCNCVPGAKRACVCSGVAGVGMQSCVGGTYGVCKCKDGAMKQVVSREEQRSTHAQNKHCPPHS